MQNKLVDLGLDKMIEEARPFSERGETANYIPALANKNKFDLAMSICSKEESISTGDIEETFTIQSVSKIITLAIALEELGFKEVFNKVGMEPSQDSFNSVSNLEKYKKPINPMVNAGAITVTNMISGRNNHEKMDKILNIIRQMANNQDITYSQSVAKSEYDTAFVNRSLCYLLKEYKMIDSDIEQLVELYTRQCSIEVNTIDLARIAMVLANNGKDPHSGKTFFSKETTKTVTTIMFMCGMYNVAGELALQVGIPTKSGVSGALIGVVPGRYGIGIYGPALNKHGNSIAGTRLLELLSSKLELHIL